MSTVRRITRQFALAGILMATPLLAQADASTTLPDTPLEVCTTSVDSSQGGSAAAVTNSNIVQGDSTLFASYYDDTATMMTGDLKAFTIDPTTGSISSTAQWSAQTILTALSNSSLSGNNSSRKFYTNIGGTATEIQDTSSFCSATNQTYLGASSESDCENIIKLLKGVNSTTGNPSVTLGTTYRIPAKRLGTIVHSEPVYVSGLNMVIQAANDGMLHAFTHNNSTIGANNSSNGSEAWTYIPKAFLNSIGQSDAPNKIKAYVTSGYTHKYWLDATPAIDKFTTTSTSGNTTTTTNTYYLSSGFAKGAKGIFSLSLGTNQSTNQNNSTPTITTLPTPLWTFDNSSGATTVDSDTGYLYGRPIITQVTIGTTTTKVAIFASGFSTFDLSSLASNSYLYVVNLTTGALIKKFSVSGKGLNYIAGFADSYSSLNQVQYVYGGDLDGNVWRFDLTSTDSNSWNVHKLASLGAPISSEPELGQITIDGTPKRFVYIGTGRYLTPSDLTTASGSMYGLIDRIDTVTSYNDSNDATVPNQLSTVTLASSNYDTSASTTVGVASNLSSYGWAANLPTGQRVINSAAIANGKVLFTANKPSNPCDTNNSSPMESWLYVIDYQTGLQTGYFSLASAATSAGLSDTHFLASRPTVVKLSSGDYRAMIRTTDGDTLNVDVGTLLTTSGGTGSAVKGVFWREVITQ
ncbi:pilus assembly protein [Pseudogulbenkiania ferrooxidans]|uniref:Type IV fimbrial biogenesis protein PilY1 n=1 Tax=Pseudogulbenkiania ferrooxidans 2002 TaxID=279714 RepID=B9Z6Z6_9NEIS|nr:PilC/PilY family type IV pilus protein [Pseudogulbenkiania ferrooxidans]EEG07311.1 type IV fimbrial biogenesis protein PilY1 [Pseudogulbenkiania ferrooxidans 2002]